MTAADEFPPDDEHKSVETEGDWVSSEPPVDDFGDPSVEAGATVSEDAEHEHAEMAADDLQDDGTPAQKKSRTPLVLFGAAALLLVAGVAAAIHFSGHQQDEESSILDMAEQNNAKSTAPHFDAKSDVAASTPAPSVSDVAPTTSYTPPSDKPIEAPKQIVETTTTTVTVSTASPAVPVSPPASLSDNNVVDVAPAPIAPPAPIAVVAAKPTETLAQALAEKPVAPPVPVVAPANVPAANTAATAEAETRVTALQNRIDELQKSLSTTTQQLSQVNEKIALAPVSAPTPTTVSIQSDATTEDRLNKLEQKIMQLEQHQTVTTTKTTKTEDIALEDNVFPSEKPVVTHKVKTVTRETHKSSVHHKGEPKTAKASSEKSHWVLRAATPTEAWVAKSDNTRELRPVHVGDVLPGIGKVTSITQKNGEWVLQGASGSIH